MKFLYFCFLFWLLSVNYCYAATKRPRLYFEDGNMKFEVPPDKVINFEASSVQINGRDITPNAQVQTNDVVQTEAFTNLQQDVNQLRDSVNTLKAFSLKFDACRHGRETPCMNGGTCIDLFQGFRCLCPPNYQGNRCNEDVDECRLYAGTHLGCQNLATCINTPGSYTCTCPPDYYGIHCTQRHDDCMSASGRELCGHGTCISQRRTQENQSNFRCICDPGWTSNTTGGPCTVDEDECKSAVNHCSKDPPVLCINFPGGYRCGPCPEGYSGDGASCVDVNECLVDNGGCSTFPRVECINTPGSRRCGPCPPGYIKNGDECLYLGICQDNNGGCSPLAQCVELSSTFRLCQCKSGYQGDGIGPNGCKVNLNDSIAPNPFDPCSSNPCGNSAFCSRLGLSYHCTCYPGYTGALCDQTLSSCGTNPCQNNGTCIPLEDGGFMCACSSNYWGRLCENLSSECGGYLGGYNGTLRYPKSPSSDNQKVSCAWVISAIPGKVVKSTFTKFTMESSYECRTTFVQIHDGAAADSRIIGRYCKEDVMKTPITSSDNHLYLWFSNDEQTSDFRSEFELQWSSEPPECGGSLTEESGLITSPGYPSQYPQNRLCYWRISVPLGKRIQFSFVQLDIETHDDCDHDKLEIFDSITVGDLLGRWCTSSTSLPSPITTSSHSATVRFTSDGEENGKGFMLLYSAVAGIPMCGGLGEFGAGRIVAPSIALNKKHVVCEWEIRTQTGHILQLEFEVLNTYDNNANCEENYIAIYDGRNMEGGSLGRYCKYPDYDTTRPLPVLQSTDRYMYIRMEQQNPMRTENNFIVHYQTVCGKNYTELNGTISGMFLNSSEEVTCFYTIRLPHNYIIQLNIFNLHLTGENHCEEGFILIQYPTINGTLLSLPKVCGDVIPDMFVSETNEMRIKFKAKKNFSFFEANYTAIPLACGGILTEMAGTISSVKATNEGYAHQTDCRWFIEAPEGFIIRLSFNQFFLEDSTDCAFDYVEITDSSGLSIGRYCGYKAPPEIRSTGNKLLLRFHTDENVSDDGFTASYVFIDGKHACGGDYYLEMGKVESPLFPKPYPGNRDCVWTLHGPTGRQFRLNFTVFDIENSTECRFDHLEIRNGAFKTSNVMGRYCGSNVPRVLISDSNSLRINFVSDRSVGGQGFQMFYDTSISGCGGTITSFSGSIMSPNYPQPYDHNAECEWVIRVSRGSVIHAIFADIDIEEHVSCQFDYVEVFDGERKQTSKALHKLCNNQQNPGVIISKGNLMTLRFRADPAISGRGFHLSYHASCNTRLTNQPRGVIESPEFPNPYPHNFNCTWTIEAMRGHNISLAFSHLDVEMSPNCSYDYVEVKQYSISSKKETTLGRYCGEQMRDIPPILSSTNIVSINFASDASLGWQGFRIEYVWQGCGGELTKPSGEITTPNYPYVYPRNTECLWHIVAPLGERIEITFLDVDMEESDGCRFDYVKVYDGPDITSPMLTQICQFINEPMKIESMSNEVVVHFACDALYSYKGMRATYRTIKIGMCRYSFSALNGLIQSQNYPNPVTEKAVTLNGILTCTYYITTGTTSAHRILFTLKDLDIPEGSNCSNGELVIRDGTSFRAPILFKGCTLPTAGNTTFITTGGKMTIDHKMIGLNRGRGFSGNYSRICGGQLSADLSGIIASRQLTDAVMMYNCTWIIKATDPGDQIQLHITHVQFPQNCSINGIEIRDGDSPDNSPLLFRICPGDPVPPTVYSNGNSVSITASRGLFRIVYSTYKSGCGVSAEYVLHRGAVASPKFPNEYPMNADCVWSLKASKGNKLNIVFTNFSLDESEFCNRDFVEIRSTDEKGPILGRFCGTTIQTFQTEQIWLRFVTDGINTDRALGFLLEYSYATDVTHTADSGILESPFFPHRANVNETFVYHIIVSNGMLVHLKPVEMVVGQFFGECKATLKIFTGMGEDDDYEVSNLCDSAVPPATVINSNVATIKFFSRINSFSSWKFEWSAINSTSLIDTAETNNETNEKFELCTKTHLFTLSNETYNLTSPNYPNNYTSGKGCRWLLRTGLHRKIAIRFDEIELSMWEQPSSTLCSIDFLYVKELTVLPSDFGETPAKPIFIGCGRYDRDKLPVNVISGTQAVDLEFISTSRDTQYAAGKGFRATAETMCGGNITMASGLIDSSVQLTSDEFECDWFITTRRGTTIFVKFIDIDIPGDDGICKNSYIEKFVFEWKEKTVECGGLTTLNKELTETTISTPGYPGRGPLHSLDCYWVVMGPPQQRIKIQLLNQLHLTGRCVADRDKVETNFVDIFDGGTVNARRITRLCGSDQPTTAFSTDNFASIHFVHSGNLQAGEGFIINLSLNDCGGTYTLGPRHPKTVEADLKRMFALKKAFECEYFIRSEDLSVISVTFSNLSLPHPTRRCNNNTNFLQIRDYNSTGEVLGHFCGINPDGRVWSSSSKLYIKVKSSGERDSEGFEISFTTTRARCGGNLDGSEGSFETPNFPEAFNERRRCMWRIRAPPGQRVTVRFTEGQLTSCQNFLRIIDRYPSTIPCAKDIPFEYKSFTRFIMVIFIFNKLPAGQGFRAEYETSEPLPCGGPLRNSSGLLELPEEVLKAQTKSLCQWDMGGAYNKTLAISILNSKILGECQLELLYLSKTNSICHAGQHAASTGNDMSITYAKRHQQHSKGLNVTYKINNCGGVIQVNRGGINISSPGYPDPYPENTDCIWVFVPTRYENFLIQLNVTDFLLPDDSACADGYLELLSGQFRVSPSLGRFCGSSGPVSGLIGRHFTVIFHATRSVPKGGFNLVLTGVEQGECGGFIHARQSRISSPQYPEKYPKNVECEWIIDMQRGFSVKLNFSASRFDLEKSHNCTKDYVAIYGWFNETWQLQTQLCEFGTDLYIVPSHRAKVVFRSDDDVERDGFQAIVSKGCGERIVAESDGVIESPGYPQPYSSELNCSFDIILKNPSDHLELFLDEEDFELESSYECRFDSLTLYANVPRTEVFKICGNTIPKKHYKLQGSNATLVFKTDLSVNKKGFSIRYQVSQCGGELREPTGIFGIPQLIADQKCVWHLYAQPDKVIELEFLQMDIGSLQKTRNCTDATAYLAGSTIHIYDGNNENAPLIYAYCGEHMPPGAKSTGPNMTVVFNVMGDNYWFKKHAAGFQIRYRNTLGIKQGCGGTFRSPSGLLTSPAVMGNFENRLLCFYKIIVESGKTVNLTIDRLDIQSKNCVQSFLEVYDGWDEHEPPMLSKCGKTPPPPIVSSRNVLMILYVAFGSKNQRGFSATYQTVQPPCGGDLDATVSSHGRVDIPIKRGRSFQRWRCRWTFKNFQSNIIVHFNRFNLSCSAGAFMQVYDKYSFMEFNEFPEARQYCGDKEIPDLMLGNIESRLLLDTEYDDNADFSFTYSAFNGSHVYKADNGLINMRVTHQSLISNTSLQLVIKPTSPDKPYLAIYFYKFDFGTLAFTQGEYIMLQVRRGETDNGPLVKNIVGHALPNPIFLRANAVHMSALFIGNNSYSHRSSSLIANFAFSAEEGGCGSVLTTTVGAITSPFYPTKQKLPRVCKWYMSFESVRFDFVEFSLNSTTPCNANFFAVFRGHTNTPQDEPIIKYCGNEQPISFTTSAGAITLVLSLNEFNPGSALYLKYRTVSSFGISTPEIFTNDLETPTRH